MWNEYIWDNYKLAHGKVVIEMFERNLSQRFDDDYSEQIKRLQEVYVADEAIRANTYEQISDVLALEKDLEEALEPSFPDEPCDLVADTETAPDEALSAIDSYFGEWCESEWREGMTGADSAAINYQDFLGYFSNENLAYYTTILSISRPTGLFVPYYFSMTYNVLENIANTFGIELPCLPAKSDYKGRVWHYANICKALYSFRVEKGLTLYELCAFLYDFAPKYVGGIDSYIIKELPAPKSAYFVGGGGRNADAVAENNLKSITRWQCNPDTRAGDLIIMYLRAPISAISSIWRAQSIGFIDPFFWYYRMTYIGNPIKINRIPLAQIKADEFLKNKWIVKKNMQGINGVELLPSEYNHIVDLSGKDICRLEYVMEVDDKNFPNEKAVEEKLIKPLLKKLGYSSSDYVQQMYIEIGNHNHALIPDFVLKPQRSAGHQSGYAIIEAKRSIKNSRQMEDAKRQVRGYAKLLGAKYSAVASMEKICVMSSQDDYTEELFSKPWGSLSDADTLYCLKKLLGKNA